MVKIQKTALSGNIFILNLIHSITYLKKIYIKNSWKENILIIKITNFRFDYIQHISKCQFNGYKVGINDAIKM